MTKPIGFIGIGAMGEPMAMRLIAAQTPLVIWSRSPASTSPFKNTPAIIADSVAEVFQRCQTVILMLASAEVLDTVLLRNTDQFTQFCSGHTLIQMGTTSPEYSKNLETDIQKANGRYVEVPVSGSRIPAENGELAAMLAGEVDTIEAIKLIIAPMIKSSTYCGPIPRAMQMKLAVNTYLSGLMSGLFEATNFARLCGLDMEQFRGVLEAGPMNNNVMRMKLPMIINEDYTSVQASVFQAVENTRMMLEAGTEVGAIMPSIENAYSFQQEAKAAGLANLDFTAVLEIYKSRNKPHPRDN